MSQSPFRAYYFDDDAAEAQENIGRLQATDALIVEYLSPTPDLQLDQVRDPDLFLVDWILSQSTVAGPKITYRGATLAARLREQYPDRPIILITRKAILDEDLREHFLDNHPEFDTCITKDRIGADARDVADQCCTLAEGYRRLGRVAKNWDGLQEALSATQEEMEKAGEASPPLERRGSDRLVTWGVPEMARWVQNVLIRYPGILYDPLHAATFLGTDLEEFRKPDVQEYLSDARYSGAFCPPEGRWWGSRLLERFMDAAVRHGLTRRGRRYGAEALSQELQRDVQPSRCVCSGETPADWVCHVLRQPVRFEYTLAYHPDSRPAVMDGARVSFKAIRETNDVLEEYFDPSAREIFDKLIAE